MVHRGYSVALCVLLAAARVRGADLVAGPMVGHVTATSARVWAQFSEACQLTINATDVDARQTIGGVRLEVDGPSPFVCDVPMQGLRPDHSYRLEFKVDGQVLKMPEFTLRTAPVPATEAAFSVAFGSDVDVMPLGTRADLPAQAIITAISGLKPRAFFFLGNTGHLPAALEDFPTTHREAYRFLTDFQSAMRRASGLRQLFSTMPCYAVYGDRDFGPAGATGNYVFANESLVAFEKYWPNPDWGTPENPGCFTSVAMGDVEFFLLDARTFRGGGSIVGSARRSGQEAGQAGGRVGRQAGGAAKEPVLLGAGQLAWLKKGLKESKAAFKILAAPCTLWGDAPGRPDSDSWSNFPAEQKAFLEWLGAEKINGIVALAGNHAAGEVTLHKEPGLAYPLFTLATSSLVLPAGARLAPPAENPQRLGGAVSECTFGTLDFSGDHDHRAVTIRLRDERGKVRAEQVILAPQLRN